MKLPLLLLAAFVLSCGKKDDDKNKGNVSLEIKYDAALFYAGGSNGCVGGNVEDLRYNRAAVVLEKETCVFENSVSKITRTVVETSSFDAAGDPVLGSAKIKEYSEITHNADGQVTDAKTWKDVDKKTLSSETKATYGADGNLTTVEAVSHFSETGKLATTYTFDATGKIQNSKSVQTTAGGTKTREDNCDFFEDVECQETEDGVVQRKVVKQGDEFVESELVGDTLMEVSRKTPLPGYQGFYAKDTEKDYDDSTKTVTAERTSECIVAGRNINCQVTQKLASGTVIYNEQTTYEVVGDSKLQVGKRVLVFAAAAPVLGIVEKKDKKRTLKAEFKGLIGQPGKLGSSGTVEVTVTNSTTDIPTSVHVEGMPDWGLLSSDGIDDIVRKGVATADFSYTFDQNYDLKGGTQVGTVTIGPELPTEQTNPTLVTQRKVN
jgi:hypothetical protein